MKYLIVLSFFLMAIFLLKKGRRLAGKIYRFILWIRSEYFHPQRHQEDFKLVRFLERGSFKEHIAYLKKQTESGVAQKKEDDKELICSLTSYPARIEKTFITIESLLKQTKKPHRICLYLAEEEFPGRLIPKTLELQKKRGLEVRWTHNIKSYKKLIPALKEFPEAVIVTFDDDFYFASSTLKNIYDAHLHHPNKIITARGRLIQKTKNNVMEPYKKWPLDFSKELSFPNIFLTGGWGCLYPISSLARDVHDESLFLHFAPHQDDVWFWAMSLLNKTEIRLIDSCVEPIGINTSCALFGTNSTQDCYGFTPNDYAIHHVLSHYDLYKKLNLEPCITTKKSPS